MRGRAGVVQHLGREDGGCDGFGLEAEWGERGEVGVDWRMGREEGGGKGREWGREEETSG